MRIGLGGNHHFHACAREDAWRRSTDQFLRSASLDQRLQTVFLGYAHQSIAYRFLVVKSEVSDMHVDTIMESRDATFFENIFFMKDMHSVGSLVRLEGGEQAYNNSTQTEVKFTSGTAAL